MYIELQVNTATGFWSLYIDDVLIGAGNSLLIPLGIDRYSFRSESFELHDIDHHYLTDGDRLGPCEVLGFPPNFQSTAQWTPLSGTNLSQIQEFGNRPLPLQTPDDQVSYNLANAAGLRDYFGFAAPPCFGRILALAVNADGIAAVSSPSLDLLVKVGSLETVLINNNSLTGDYGIRQGIQQLNPVTGIFWTDADISAALFGYQMAGAGTARVTQLMVEKLVSSRNVPFDCGAGSYAFSS
jgi:hypothetical protein